MNENDLTLSGTRAGTGNEVFGIDLGTTYSAIAWLDQNGKPETLANIDGSPTTPSVVYFESPDNIVVGETAKEMIPQEPNRVVSFIKREMGNSAYAFETPDGQSYSPIEISGFILKKLVKDAEAKTGSPVKNVVITCPAYFGTDEHGRQRRPASTPDSTSSKSSTSRRRRRSPTGSRKANPRLLWSTTLAAERST